MRSLIGALNRIAVALERIAATEEPEYYTGRPRYTGSVLESGYFDSQGTMVSYGRDPMLDCSCTPPRGWVDCDDELCRPGIPMVEYRTYL